MQSANPGIAPMEHRGTVVGWCEHDNPPRLGPLSSGHDKRQQGWRRNNVGFSPPTSTESSGMATQVWDGEELKLWVNTPQFFEHTCSQKAVPLQHVCQSVKTSLCTCKKREETFGSTKYRRITPCLSFKIKRNESSNQNPANSHGKSKKTISKKQ